MSERVVTGEEDFLRILHLSDLHLGEPDRPIGAVAGADTLEGARALLGEKPKEFGHRLVRLFEATPPLPDVLIVSGDLVDRAGTGVGEPLVAYQHATAFVGGVAESLGIPKTRVLVVPGNHDIERSGDYSPLQRFAKYHRAVEDFESPSFVNGSLQARIVDLSAVKNIPVHVALLASPMLSGVRDPVGQAVADRLRGIVRDLDEDSRGKVLEAIDSSVGLLDVAALGSSQRLELSWHGDEASIGIAVVHHHLLPDPNIEVAAYEAVVDAGAVLERLLECEYRLVLTGHKHNRRLAHYRSGGAEITVCSAPSLFQAPTPQQCGFSVIDIFGSRRAEYGRVRSYNRLCQLDPGRAVALVKASNLKVELEGRLADVVGLGGEDGAQAWLNGMAEALGWWQGHPASELFGSLWQRHMESIEQLGSGRLCLRLPECREWWEWLLMQVSEHAEAGSGAVRMVSNEDLGFWVRAYGKRDPRHASAEGYVEGFKIFNGQKRRILVLRSAACTTNGRHLSDEATRASLVIARMVDDGFHVSVVRHGEVPVELRRADFGIIGDLACLRFMGTEEGLLGLVLDFAPEELAKADQQWQGLLDIVRWKSDGQTTFPEWLMAGAAS